MKYYIFSEIYLILMVNNATHICHDKTLGAMMMDLDIIKIILELSM